MSVIMTVLVIFVISGYIYKFSPPKEILDEGVLLVYPRMTEIAYANGSFYDYYFKRCDEKCLTVSTDKKNYEQYNEGKKGFYLLKKNYNEVEDIHLRNVNLSKYHTVILFHNEYVTQDVFDKITNHPNVIYLYPNSLYALVDVDYHAGTMKLIRGHGYPSPEIGNGFRWKYDNTEQEKDCRINKWNFNKIPNGIMLDCYPEQIIRNDTGLKSYIFDYIRNSSENKNKDSFKTWQAWK